MLRQLMDEYQSGHLTLPDLLSRMRPYYHSLRDPVRQQVVDLLGMLPDAEASRELVLLFRHSLWRTTRLQIVQALARHPSPRGLEFLMRLATDERDLTLSERSLWALGASRSLFASRFLVHLYGKCSEALAPKVVAAIGNSLDPALSTRFLGDLDESLANGKMQLARNLALALAEFKEPRVIPHLRSMATQTQQPLVAQSALLALGKVARDPSVLADLEERFQTDFYSFQLFTSVRNQIHFRAQWKLEDYLLKLFEARDIHPALPFELNGFDPSEVREGLLMFREPRHLPRLGLALGRRQDTQMDEWYREFFPASDRDDFSMATLLRSVRFHHGERLRPLLSELREAALRSSEDSVADAWCEAVSLALPRPEDLFEESIELMDGLEESRRIAFLNHLTNAALMADARRQKGFVKIIESTLLRWSSTRGRSLGQLESAGNKTHPFIREHLDDEALLPSILFLIEKAPSRQSADVLQELTAKPANPRRRTALLKAWSTQKEIPGDAEQDFVPLVMTCLDDVAAPVPRTEALFCVAAHPRAAFVPLVQRCLRDESVQLPAVLAAKSLADEALIEPLGGCLQASSESVVGRAIDALTSYASPRAKRLVLDFLLKHPLDLDLCDKAIRCLRAPQGAGDFFAQKIEELLAAHPNHPLRDGLEGLRDTFRSGARMASLSADSTPPELTAIDAHLAQRISGYRSYENDVKSALRAAEIPFHRPEFYQGIVDKSATIIAYSKAVDLLLERQLGRRHLFPQLEASIHEFQNVIFTVGLDDSGVSPQRASEALGVAGRFNSESLPIHKMTLVSQGILSGKILSEHWKVVDGLRAWAVILLLFARAPLPCLPQKRRPLIDLGAEPDTIIDFAKRLIALQDLRNPLAHRETWLRFPELDEVRANVTDLLRQWQRISGQK